MAIPALGDFWEVLYCCSWSNQYAINRRTYSVRSITGAPNPAAGEVAASFYNHVASDYIRILPTDASFYGVQAKVVSPYDGVADTFVAPTSGTYPGTCGAPQLAGLARFTTGLAGRTQKGRMYSPFPASGAIAAGGAYTGLYSLRLRTLAQQIAAPFIAVVTGGTMGFQLTQDVMRHSAPGDMIYLSIADFFATMRSRNKLYGPDVAPF